METIKVLRNTQILLLGICITVGTIISSLIISKGLLEIKKFSNEVITVTGYSEKKIISDFIIWRSGFSRRDIEMTTAYKYLNEDLKKVKEYLLSKGVKNEEIIVPQISITTLYKVNEKGYSTNDIEGYLLTQSIEVRSFNVLKVAEVSMQATELINEDITLFSNPPEYIYTRLADLKIEMLGLAAADAKKRADTLANSTGNKIGTMRSADMGVFQITPIYSNEVSSWGQNDTSSYEKKITAVAHVSYSIKE